MSDLKSGKDKSEYEDVLCVNDSWGYPLKGIALYQSEPYAFDCIFDVKSGDWSNIYFLTPKSEEILSLSLENWSIWLRWMNNSSNVLHPVLYKEYRATKTIEVESMLYKYLPTKFRHPMISKILQLEWQKKESY